MPEKNVEIASCAYAAFNHGGVEAAMEFFHPEIEIHDFPEIPDTRTYRGHDGFRELHRNVDALFEDMRWEPVEYIDAGDNLIVMTRTVGKGRGSGVEVDATVAHVWTIRDGKAHRLRLLGDRGEALEAAGLSE
jgi:ketosteroid isomerase-like protein